MDTSRRVGGGAVLAVLPRGDAGVRHVGGVIADLGADFAGVNLLSRGQIGEGVGNR